MSKEEKKKGVNIFFKIVIVLILIIIILLGVAFFYVKGKLDKIQKVELPKDEELGITEEIEQKLTGYRNIAIFGVDSRADDYGRGNRSDCIVIASINNDTGEIKLASVYRDTYVNIDGYGLDKITHAYSYGEAPLAIKTLNKNLDLNINEFVTVNFDSVAEAVDQLGGIKLTIDSEEIKYINGYIDETSRVTGKKSQHITQPGTYTVDGVQAVAYSRIRYTAGGDYKRTERMRTVIEAMFAKLKTRNLKEINSFADAILPHVYTNISATDIISMVPSMAKYKVTESVGWPYNTKGKTMDRWYGIPVTLESNVIQLHKEIFGEEDYVPSDTVKSISQSIVNKTGYKN
ncbi:MAG: LCP family protein [Clostridia bacterium]|nr:LCP family protein [Clostridia bacterium]